VRSLDAGKPRGDAGIPSPEVDSRSRVAWSRVKNCALATPLPWCTVKAAGPTTIMTLDPAVAQEFAVAVHYTDERVQGQPVLCLRSYRDGKMRTERCDPVKRSADEWWDVGVIDTLTGKTPEAIAQEAAASAARAAAAAAAASAAADAGQRADGAGASDARPEASVLDSSPRR
jgi:hypothetical protein